MNFKKISFSRMKDPVSRRQRVKGQMGSNVEATTFSSILEMKLRFEIGPKLLRSSVDRWFFR